MDLVTLPSILRRWWWAVALVVVLSLGAIGARVFTEPALYDTQVQVQITAPQVDDVALYGEGNRSSSYLRDDLTLVRNNFTAVVRSKEVRNRTIAAMHLTEPDRAYQVSVRPVADSDFIDVVFSARSASLSRSIADEHIAQARKYYGELRAMPATAMKALLNGEVSRVRSDLLKSVGNAPHLSDTATNDSLSLVEAQHLRDTYKFLLSKQVEAALTEDQALQATYIQVAQPAGEPIRQSRLHTLARLGGLTLIGSLGLGVLLAVGLDALFRGRTSLAPRFADAAPGTPFIVGRSG